MNGAEKTAAAVDPAPAAKSVRQPGLDVIRTLAVLLVMTTHGIAYLGVMNEDVCSLKWDACCVLRFAALTCVPLFLLLTGYLQRKKELSARYFRGVLPVVSSYLAVSAAVTAAMAATHHAEYTVWSAVQGILNFTTHGYAWYVEMYIGLFLCIPFLNLLWQRLEDRWKLFAIGALVVLTMLPAALETFRIGGTAVDILPDYWEICYPVTYYCIGAWIGEKRPKIPKLPMLGVTVLAVLLPSGLCRLLSSPEAGYAWYTMNGFQCVTTAAMAVCIFLLLYDISLPKPAAAVFREFSVCSFEMYLLSYPVDLLLYGRTRYFLPAMVLTVFAGSYALARVMRLALVPVWRALGVHK